MKIAPAAVVDDGLLDVVVIEAASKLSLMRSLPKVYDGAHVDLPEVTVLHRPAGRARRRRRAARSRSVATASRSARCRACAGEPAVVEVLPGALSVARAEPLRFCSAHNVSGVLGLRGVLLPDGSRAGRLGADAEPGRLPRRFALTGAGRRPVRASVADHLSRLDGGLAGPRAGRPGARCRAAVRDVGAAQQRGPGPGPPHRRGPALGPGGRPVPRPLRRYFPALHVPVESDALRDASKAEVSAGAAWG